MKIAMLLRPPTLPHHSAQSKKNILLCKKKAETVTVKLKKPVSHHTDPSSQPNTTTSYNCPPLSPEDAALYFVGCVLQELTEQFNNKNQDLFSDSEAKDRLDWLSLKFRVEQIFLDTQVERSCLLVALQYLERIMRVPIMAPSLIGYEFEHYCVCLTLACKVNEDRFILNKDWANVYGIPLAIFNIMERNVLNALEFELVSHLGELNTFMYSHFIKSERLRTMRPWTDFKEIIKLCARMGTR